MGTSIYIRYFPPIVTLVRFIRVFGPIASSHRFRFCLVFTATAPNYVSLTTEMQKLELASSTGVCIPSVKPSAAFLGQPGNSPSWLQKSQ